MSEVLDEFFAGNSPLARAYRDHIFRDLFPDTEPSCRLKLLKRKPGRLSLNECLNGAITHVGEDCYVFIEDAPETKSRRRYPSVYQGVFVNIHKMDDGMLYPTIRYGKLFNRSIAPIDFCLGAAQELLGIVRLIEEEGLV